MSLVVWDSLEVGPIVLEPARLRVPYRVRSGEQVEETVLTFKWAEPVFDPSSPLDQQLATMVGAQCALNYGLFCNELVVHGPLGPEDRSFLIEMARNTATEIYVNKLRAPNRSLTEELARRLPETTEPASLCARLRFPDAVEPMEHPPFGRDPRTVAILASGGKESLLTQGVCEELGLDTHALFANESGRHWFTALNAWRHLSRSRPERTARVWTDCDRLYTWMLRRLPFVRVDFEKLRADDYPIRLWTVGVFLFGCLPLARKRGAMRLFIGDEWDTTTLVETDGIRHYAGLFDQSRFFDEVLCHYFARKGWGVLVCSLLRPLSELLVEDTLATRYPELFALQVSCHAARVEGERAAPCGRCEKCRRIVGMLVGLGHDPRVLGYPVDVQQRCLHDLAQRGAKQAEDGEHLAWMLLQRGRLPAEGTFSGQAQCHPESQCLRFDAERSPMNTVPRDLRRDTWRIFLAHAEGAVRKVGEAWVRFGLLGSDGPPHPFEDEGIADDAVIPAGHPTWRLGELTWPQARRRLAESSVALLPVGAVEQHGPHLPLDIDAWDAAHLCEEVAKAAAGPKPLVLPLLPYGVSYHHRDFPGTISVGPDTLARMVHEIGMCIASQGIEKLLIVNGHGGNGPALAFAAQLINRDAHIFTAVDTGETSDAEISALVESQADAHAGEFETSTALATRPHLVYLEHARPDVPLFDSPFLDFDSDTAVEWHVHTKRISDSGVLGDPTLATAEKGREMWAIQIRNLTRLVDFLQATPLAELHRRGRGDV